MNVVDTDGTVLGKSHNCSYKIECFVNLQFGTFLICSLLRLDMISFSVVSWIVG